MVGTGRHQSIYVSVVILITISYNRLHQGETYGGRVEHVIVPFLGAVSLVSGVTHLLDIGGTLVDKDGPRHDVLHVLKH